ncbi:MAG: YqiA/YcfP family alpha/beta fold hydrolase [Bacteroidia bacterium]|nr:YqiA/YcfP family alpha/beta fold hydrolase [Bacteroidia bacterium]
MKTILFLHGFFASGSCDMAKALKAALKGRVNVLTPDIPIRPKEALEVIHKICDKEKPSLLVGNSCGSFYAQIMAPIVGVPALLSNPHFKMTEFLKERVGEHQYKSERADGKQELVIDERLIEEFAEVEAEQFNYCNPYYRDKVWGIFGEADTLARFEHLFIEHYNNVYTFPGAHTPTAEEVKIWHVPLIEKMLMTYERREERYFQHFKGGMYKFVSTAFDSETEERVVVYQALYGDNAIWVRREKMFFEMVERDGKRFSRFVEVER